MAELAEDLVELGAHRRARMRVERGQRLVEQQHRRVARERPRESDPLALAARERPCTRAPAQVRDPEALEQLAHIGVARRAEADVRRHVEVGEERVLLEQVAHPPPLGREVDAPARVEPRLARDARPGPRPGSSSPEIDAQHGRLPRARRPDERERRAVADAQLDERRRSYGGNG